MGDSGEEIVKETVSRRLYTGLGMIAGQDPCLTSAQGSPLFLLNVNALCCFESKVSEAVSVEREPG